MKLSPEQRLERKREHQEKYLQNMKQNEIPIQQFIKEIQSNITFSLFDIF